MTCRSEGVELILGFSTLDDDLMHSSLANAGAAAGAAEMSERKKEMRRLRRCLQFAFSCMGTRDTNLEI